MHPHILTQGSLTIYADGKPLAIHVDDERWTRAMALLRAGDDDSAAQLAELMQPAVVVKRALDAGLSGPSGIVLTDGRLYMNGQPLDASQDYTVRQIVSFNAQGLPVKPLISFYERLQANPSFRVRRDLLKFLEVGELPITEEGSFMAYKRVDAEFKDIHSHTIDYTPGRTVEMDRTQVDDDPNNTCSAGLHVCSYGYLGHFGGERVITVMVHPADVVSIPTDYDNTKMRVCKLVSVGEIPVPDRKNVWDTPLVEERRYALQDQSDHEHEDEDLEDEEQDEAREPLKFKVGHRVKVTTSGVDGFGTIIALDLDDEYHPYRIFIDGLDTDQWFSADDVEALAEDPKVEQAPAPVVPQPKFAVGDCVRFHGFTGRVQSVHQNEHIDGEITYDYRVWNDQFHHEQLRTEDELQPLG